MRAHYYDTLQMDIEDKSTGYDYEVPENIQIYKIYKYIKMEKKIFKKFLKLLLLHKVFFKGYKKYRYTRSCAGV